MPDLLGLSTSLLTALALGLYALAFIAGGIYYLEQQATRLRDLFPSYGPRAVLIGWTAMGIGVLAAVSVGGHLMGRGSRFGYGALVAAGSGVAFWVIRIHIDPTRGSRTRDVLLALVCALLTALTAWWTTTI